MGGSRGGRGPDPPPRPEKSQKYRISLQYWSGSPEKSQSCQASINVRPSSARQRNVGVSLGGGGGEGGDDGPLLVVFRSSHQLKKSCQSWTPSDKIFSIHACFWICIK